MDQSRSRRNFLRWGASAAVLPALGSIARAADPIDASLRQGLMSLLPGKKGRNAQVIDAILALEQRAEAQRLPLSSLAPQGSGGTQPPLSAHESSYYKSAMPRLVALVDRGTGRDPALADEAGHLLSIVNEDQHEVPDALRRKGAPALSRARTYAALRDEYRRLWESVSLKAEHQETADWYMSMARKSRLNYEDAANRTGVPWFFIAAIHGLEASYNFRGHLHNGDFPLTRRTRQVPSGRPLVWLPPSDWTSSAVDALKLMGFAGQSDWSVERTLYRLEAYNGFGYRAHGIATPYLWSFSDHYDRGKFVSDGSWSATAKSQQCGAAVLLKMLTDAGEISFADGGQVKSAIPPTSPSPSPAIASPAETPAQPFVIRPF